MNTEIKTWLYDVLKAIEEIDGFLSDAPKNFFTYQQNLVKRAPAIAFDLSFV